MRKILKKYVCFNRCKVFCFHYFWLFILLKMIEFTLDFTIKLFMIFLLSQFASEFDNSPKMRIVFFFTLHRKKIISVNLREIISINSNFLTLGIYQLTLFFHDFSGCHYCLFCLWNILETHVFYCCNLK